MSQNRRIDTPEELFELLKELLESFKEKAKKCCERNKIRINKINAMQCIIGGKATSNSIKLLKAEYLTNAGIYNKNKEMYLKGCEKQEKVMRENMEGNFDDCELLQDDGVSNFDDLEVVAKNENAYLKMCNYYRDEKKRIDERHGDLMKFCYFDSTDTQLQNILSIVSLE